MAELRHITIGDQQDMVVWKWTGDRQFTVKSYYQAIKQGPYIKSKISVIWNLKAPHRV